MIKKLRRQFVSFVMLSVMFVVAVSVSFLYLFTKNSIDRDTFSFLLTIASDPGQSHQKPSAEMDDIVLPNFTLMADHASGEISVIEKSHSYDLSDQSFLSELVSIAEKAKRGKYSLPDNENSERFQNLTVEKTGDIRKYDLRFLSVKGPGDSSIIAFADVSSETIALRNLRRTCAVIGYLLFVVIHFLSVFLGNIAIKPVEEAWKRQRQFVADASHELKTPLTVILTNSELLQSDDFSGEQKKGFVSAIRDMSEQMRGLVESLLNLTRIESEESFFAELDFSSAVADVVLPFEPLFFEKGLSIESRIEPELKVMGVESELRQTVEILLDNAQKYCYPNSKTEITLARQGGRCLLSVSEPGDELSPEDRKKIFSRFYRVDKTRSSDGSYGLGLSIARDIVEKHSGKIYAESSGGINTFCVQLPLTGK